MQISTDQFVRSLSQPGVLRESDSELLVAHHDCRSCEATATQLCALLGLKDKVVVNGRFGRLGKRIAKSLDLTMPQRDDGIFQFWNVLADGYNQGRSFVWKLRPELIEALDRLGVLGAKRLLLAEEVPASVDLFEGARQQISVNAFERNATARQICVQHYGARCQVCEFDFECVYGEVGAGFIHVHHLRELSEIGSAYKVDPVQDLRPVCPNCHAMLHRESPALTIEALKTRLRR